MSIQLSLLESDYRCLLERALVDSSVHAALVKAVPTGAGAKTTWTAVFGILDVIRLLRLARELCPGAVADIRRTLSVFGSRA